MAEPFETDYLKPFIESTIDAAARFRRVLIVMITASILAVGAFWNSLDETWFNSRIAAARNGEALLTLDDLQHRLQTIESDLTTTEAKKNQNLEEKEMQELIDRQQGLNKEKEGLLNDVNRILKERFGRELQITKAKELDAELSRDHYKPTRAWIEQRMMPNKEQATRYAQRLEDTRTMNILLIHIPFFETVFDVNALGLWGGITFMVILLLFRFSLWREYNNLKLTFQETKPEHERFCYMSLAMQQVLTVPPALSRSQPHLKPKGWVVQALYFPPLIIQIAIIINDIRTQKVGDIFSSKLTLVSIGGSLVFWAVIVVLTVKCLQLSFAIDREWANAAKRIHSGFLGKWYIQT